MTLQASLRAAKVWPSSEEFQALIPENDMWSEMQATRLIFSSSFDFFAPAN
jgi:hypothetical protein